MLTLTEALTLQLEIEPLSTDEVSSLAPPVIGARLSTGWQARIAGLNETSEDRARAKLLVQEADAFKGFSGSDRDKAREFAVEVLAAIMNDDIVVADELISGPLKNLGLTKTVAKAAAAKLLAVKAEAAREEAQKEGAKAVALDGSDPLIFDGRRYYRREKDGRFGALCREDALLHLGVHGFNNKREGGEPSAADRALYELQTKNRVIFAGPLCGRPAGLREENGIRLLCTAGPTMIETCEGEFPTIRSYLMPLLGEGQDELFQTQHDILISWIKLGREAVRNPDRYLPGHVLALVGPPDCGKSMFQKMILTPAFGGRVSDPGQWLKNETTFNDDMWGAEHLALGDKKLSGNPRARDELRDALKELVASPDYKFHPKGESGRTLSPIWRLSLTANDDLDSINHLPTLDGGFDDKVIILKMYSPAKSLWDVNDRSGRENFEKAIREELPAFLHFVDAFEIPEKLRKGRFGVTEWHHPKVAEVMGVNEGDRMVANILEEWAKRVIGAPDADTAKRGFTDIKTEDLFDLVTGESRRLKSLGLCDSAVHFGRILHRIAKFPGWSKKMFKMGQKDGGYAWRFPTSAWQKGQRGAD